MRLDIAFELIDHPVLCKQLGLNDWDDFEKWTPYAAAWQSWTVLEGFNVLDGDVILLRLNTVDELLSFDYWRRCGDGARGIQDSLAGSSPSLGKRAGPPVAGPSRPIKRLRAGTPEVIVIDDSDDDSDGDGDRGAYFEAEEEELYLQAKGKGKGRAD